MILRDEDELSTRRVGNAIISQPFQKDLRGYAHAIASNAGVNVEVSDDQVVPYRRTVKLERRCTVGCRTLDCGFARCCLRRRHSSRTISIKGSGFGFDSTRSFPHDFARPEYATLYETNRDCVAPYHGLTSWYCSWSALRCNVDHQLVPLMLSTRSRTSLPPPHRRKCES
jgi:hypothetical protein